MLLDLVFLRETDDGVCDNCTDKVRYGTHRVYTLYLRDARDRSGPLACAQLCRRCVARWIPAADRPQPAAVPDHECG